MTQNPAALTPDIFDRFFDCVFSRHTAEIAGLLKIHGAALANARREDTQSTALHILCKDERTQSGEIFERLVEHGAALDVFDKAGNTPLYYAIANQNDAACGRLLAAGANVAPVRSNGMSAITLAYLHPGGADTSSGSSYARVTKIVRHYHARYLETLEKQALEKDLAAVHRGIEAPLEVPMRALQVRHRRKGHAP